MKIERKTMRCDQCTNHCKLTVTRFGVDADGVERLFVAGNRCDKGAAAFDSGYARRRVPPNMFKVENALIASCDHQEQPESALVVGIPKVLALYESYPFWKRFFNALGYSVVAGAPTDDGVFRAGMSSIPAEGSCYPSKLVYGHAVELAKRGADVIFAPNMGTSFAREGLLGLPFDPTLVTCPLVENMGTMLAGNVDGTILADVRIATPQLRGLANLDEAVVPLAESLGEAGLACSEEAVRDALVTAQEAYRAFFDTLAKRNDDILARVDAGEIMGALVVHHAYHIDPGISHEIDELLGKLGYAVVGSVAQGVPVGEGQRGADGGRAFDWTENARVLDELELSRAHPNLQVIVLRSFGCGVDALVADEVHDRLRCDGRVYAELKLDQIIDLAAVRIRLRSLAYAARQRRDGTQVAEQTSDVGELESGDQWVAGELDEPSDDEGPSLSTAKRKFKEEIDYFERPPEVAPPTNFTWSDEPVSLEIQNLQWGPSRLGGIPPKRLSIWDHPPKVTPPGLPLSGSGTS